MFCCFIMVLMLCLFTVWQPFQSRTKVTDFVFTAHTCTHTYWLFVLTGFTNNGFFRLYAPLIGRVTWFQWTCIQRSHGKLLLLMVFCVVNKSLQYIESGFVYIIDYKEFLNYLQQTISLVACGHNYG